MLYSPRININRTPCSVMNNTVVMYFVTIWPWTFSCSFRVGVVISTGEYRLHPIKTLHSGLAFLPPHTDTDVAGHHTRVLLDECKLFITGEICKSLHLFSGESEKIQKLNNYFWHWLPSKVTLESSHHAIEYIGAGSYHKLKFCHTEPNPFNAWIFMQYVLHGHKFTVLLSRSSLRLVKDSARKIFGITYSKFYNFWNLSWINLYTHIL